MGALYTGSPLCRDTACNVIQWRNSCETIRFCAIVADAAGDTKTLDVKGSENLSIYRVRRWDCEHCLRVRLDSEHPCRCYWQRRGDPLLGHAVICLLHTRVVASLNWQQGVNPSEHLFQLSVLAQRSCTSGLTVSWSRATRPIRWPLFLQDEVLCGPLCTVLTWD